MSEKKTHHNVGDVIREEIAKQVEERLRHIVREELKSFLRSANVTARNADGHETGELESAGLRAIRTVIESEIYYLPHTWGCSIRKPMVFTCDCGVGVDD